MTNILLHKTLNSSHSLSQKFFFQVKGGDTLSCCHLRFFLPSPENENNNHNFLSLFQLPKIKLQIILLTALRENLGQPSLSNSIEFVIPQVLIYLKTKFIDIDFRHCIFIEHANNFSYNQPHEYEDYDFFSLVKLDPQSHTPIWQSISADHLSHIIHGNFNNNFKCDRKLKSFLIKNWNPFLRMDINEILLEAHPTFLEVGVSMLILSR